MVLPGVGRLWEGVDWCIVCVYVCMYESRSTPLSPLLPYSSPNTSFHTKLYQYFSLIKLYGIYVYCMRVCVCASEFVSVRVCVSFSLCIMYRSRTVSTYTAAGRLKYIQPDHFVHIEYKQGVYQSL